MLSFFNKKKKEVVNEESTIVESTPVKEEKVSTPEPIVIKEEVKHDPLTKECISMGMDMKAEASKISKAFFNSKNELKETTYLKFQSFLSSLTKEKIREIQEMSYLEFKDKEEQIQNTLKNGFGQFLSKGATLDEESRKSIDLVFGDIKKMQARGHRYWFYKIYIWQKRGEDLVE